MYVSNIDVSLLMLLSLHASISRFIGRHGDLQRLRRHLGARPPQSRRKAHWPRSRRQDSKPRRRSGYYARWERDSTVISEGTR